MLHVSYWQFNCQSAETVRDFRQPKDWRKRWDLVSRRNVSSDVVNISCLFHWTLTCHRKTVWCSALYYLEMCSQVLLWTVVVYNMNYTVWKDGVGQLMRLVLCNLFEYHNKWYVAKTLLLETACDAASACGCSVIVFIVIYWNLTPLMWQMEANRMHLIGL